MLHKKLLRDLLRQRWQVIAVILVVLLGTALFDASYLAYRNLQHSYSATQVHTHLADETLTVTNVTNQQTQTIRQITGVAAVGKQLIVSLPVVVPHGQTVGHKSGRVQVDGRLISIPFGHQPALNQLVIVSGHYPQDSNQVLVERHFAEYQGIKPGDKLSIQTPAGPQTVSVSGVAVSASYLWVARNRQDVFPSPADFGVFFVPQEKLTELAKSSIQALTAKGETSTSNSSVYDLQLAAANQGNRLLFTYATGANHSQVLAKVKAVIGDSHILAITPRKKQLGIQLLQMDLNGFKQMAEAFPLFFLTVAAFIVAALMNRLVNQERTLIGTMMAIGVRRRSVLTHYLTYSLLIGITGVVLGTGAGLWMGDAMTTAYATELHIPFVFTQANWGVLIGGVVLGLIAPLLAGIFPALKAARLEPAEAMRAFAPQHKKRLRQRTTHARGPLWWRLSSRDLFRHPGRTLGTAAGVMAALILVVTTAGLEDSMTRGLNVSFNQSLRYDLRADFYLPQSDAQLHQQLKAITGVKQAQTMLTLPAQVVNPATGKDYNTVLQGISPHMTLLQLHVASGARLIPQQGKAILSTSIAKKLGLKVGDKVRIKLLPHGNSVTLPIGALDFSTLGNSVTLPMTEAANDFHLQGRVTTALVTTSQADRVAVRTHLGELPGVVRVQDQAALRAQIHQIMGLMNLMLGVMLLFAVILAASILFNTASLNILERQRELATMRALGYPVRSIIALVTVGNGWIGLIGLIIGFPVALLSLNGFLGLYQSDLFSLPFWLYPRTVVLAVVGILLVLLFAQWPALRIVTRMNLADAAKMRE